MQNKVISFVLAVVRAINWGGLTLILPCLVIMTVVDVTLRYAFNSPLLWGVEVSGYMLLMVFFFSVTHCWVTDGHVRMNLVTDRLGSRWQAIFNAFSVAAGFIFWGLLLWQSIEEFLRDFKTHETGMETGLPIWPFKALIAATCFLFCVQLMISFFQSFWKIKR